MVMLAERYDFVIGGDPDRDTIDLAVLDTGTGRVGAHLADTADGAGYRRMLTWAGEHAPRRNLSRRVRPAGVMQLRSLSPVLDLRSW